MKNILVVCMIALCSATLFAQQHLRTATPTSNSFQVVTSVQSGPAGLKKIFSNLGPKTPTYDSEAWVLNGPLSGSGQEFIAMPFTPKANATVTQVQAAVQYAGSGANQIDLSLYSDASGAPGTLLGGPVTVTGLPTFSSCCSLAVANFSVGVSVTAGTQYWVVADTPTSGTGSDFKGTWNFVPPTKTPVSFDQSTTWFSIKAAIQEPAGAVYGTIP